MPFSTRHEDGVSIGDDQRVWIASDIGFWQLLPLSYQSEGYILQMGNLCIPDTLIEPLELIVPLPTRTTHYRTLNDQLPTQEEEKQPRLSEDVVRKCEEAGRRGEETGRRGEEEGRRFERQQEEGLMRLMGAFRVSDMTILSGLVGSDYSKLNRHEFRQVIVPPSSARLTVIDRLESEEMVPDEIFMVAIVQSQLKRLRSFKLPVKYKRAESLK